MCESLSANYSKVVDCSPAALLDFNYFTCNFTTLKVERLVFVQHLSVAVSAAWQFFFTQNKSVQVKIMLNFSKLLYCGLSQVLQQ